MPEELIFTLPASINSAISMHTIGSALISFNNLVDWITDLINATQHMHFTIYYSEFDVTTILHKEGFLAANCIKNTAVNFPETLDNAFLFLL